MKRKKLVSLALGLAFLLGSMFISAFIFSEADITAYAATMTVNSKNVTIYGMNSWADDYLKIPSGKATYYQLEVSGASNPTYKVVSGESVKVNGSGKIEANYATTYWYGGIGFSTPLEGETPTKITRSAEYGESVVRVTSGSQSIDVKVTLIDYADEYADKIIDDYIAKNISSSMTGYEKICKACEFVASYDYSSEHSGVASMIVCGGGDCLSSTKTIIRFCDKLGLDSWARNGNKDTGAGNGHMNVMVYADGKYYMAEAGMVGTAPRSYFVEERTSLYSYKQYSGYDGIEVYQYDGKEKIAVQNIPAEIDGYKVVGIGERFLSGDETVTTVKLPATVQYVKDMAFYYCTNLKSINLPASVTSIGEKVFANCPKLTNLTCDSANKAYCVSGGALYDKGKTVLLNAPAVKTISLPSTVKAISPYAFYCNSNLTSIKIPKSVTAIEEATFARCTSLSSVTFEGDSVKSIGYNAFFWCLSLKNIRIPRSVTSIGGYAFGSDNFESLIIPSKLTEIGDCAFWDCRYLKTVYYTGSKSQWNKIKIGDYNDYFKNATVYYDFNDSLEAPKISSVENVATGVKITWGKVEGAAKYRIFYKANDESSWHKITDTTSTSYTWTDAKSNTKYTFAVRCVSPDGNIYTSASSAGKSIKYIAAPKLSPASSAATGAKIVWGKVAGAEKYRVFYKTDGGSWTVIGDTTSTSYTWKEAKSGTKYTFTVRCVTADGKSFTSAFDGKGKTLTYIAAPKLSSADNAATGVKITWGKVAGASKYRIFYKANDESSWHKITDTTATSYTWTKAKSNTKYTFAVRCTNADGTEYTSVSSGVKSVKYIAAPKLSAVTNAATGVKITWGKVAGAAKYRVFYKTGNSGWKKIGDTASTSYTWKDAKSGTKYTFTVRCITSDGKSFTSAFDGKGKTITFLSAPKISSLAKNASGVQIKWSKVTGAVNYKVFRKTANGSWVAIGTATGTSFVDKTAKKGTKYTYTVRCVSKDGKTYTSGYDATGKSITA